LRARRRARGLRAALLQVGQSQLASNSSASLNAVVAEISGYSGLARVAIASHNGNQSPHFR
jgi:hypothetical protein